MKVDVAKEEGEVMIRVIADYFNSEHHHGEHR
jgi:hypothetical protein